MTERAQNADFRRKPQIFADSLLLEIQAFGGRRKPQKNAVFRRKPKIFAENRRKPQIVLCHLRCVTLSSALGHPLLPWGSLDTLQKSERVSGVNEQGQQDREPLRGKPASERVSEGSLRGRFSEFFFQRLSEFLEVFRVFLEVFRVFFEVFRGPLRDPLREPLRGKFPSQRLSVFLPRIVLPLELSPKEYCDTPPISYRGAFAKVCPPLGRK